MGLDDDADCAHASGWVLVEMRPSLRGMERVEQCADGCGALTFVPAQAALRDRRPPL